MDFFVREKTGKCRISWRGLWVVMLAGLLSQLTTRYAEVVAVEPLHLRIDSSIGGGHPGSLGSLSSDVEFLRRIYLDLHGTVPSTDQVRAFLTDESADKRAKVIDKLLADPRFARFMATTFDVMMMERQADKHIKTPQWRAYLYESFLSGKGLDQLSREILSADGVDPKLRPSARFYLDREVETNRLTRDVGRIFFGMDLQCAQCHDHPLVDDYYQEDYYGIFAFLNRSFIFTAKDKKVFFAEKAEGNVSFTSVFTKEAGESGPCLPASQPIKEPEFKKGEEYQVKPAKDVRPIPKYSRRQQLALLATSGKNQAFNRNFANRLWAHMMGKGLVEPVDFNHSDNPAVNPELMDVLSQELVAMKFDIRSFLRELALSQTYQRSLDMPTELSLPSEQAKQQVAALEASHKQRITAVQQLSGEIQKLSKERLQEKEALAPLAKQLTDLAKPLAELQKKAAAAQKAATESKQKLTLKQEQLAALQAAATATGQVAKILPKEAELQKAGVTLSNRAKQVEAQVAAAQKDYQPKQAASLAANKMLSEKEQTANEVGEQVKQLKAKIAALTVKMRETRFAYQAENQHVTLLVNRISDIRLMASYGELATTATASRQKLDDVSTPFRTLTEKTTMLSSEFVKLEDALQKATQANVVATREIGQLQQRQVALKELGQLLPQVRDHLKNVATQLPKDSEVSQVQQQINDRQAKLVQDVSQVAKALTENETLRKSSAEQMTQLQPLVATTKKQRDDAMAELAKLKKEYEVAKAQAKESEEKRLAVYNQLVESWERRFAVAGLKPMTPEQLAWSMMQTLGVWEKQRIASRAELDKKSPLTEADKKDAAKLANREKQLEDAVYEKLKKNVASFVSLFGAGAGQPQGDFFATVDQALFLANGGLLRGWLAPGGGNLSDRLNKEADVSALTEELYVSVLSRRPTESEAKKVAGYLESRGMDRTQAIQEMVWALLTSVEFRFNH